MAVRSITERPAEERATVGKKTPETAESLNREWYDQEAKGPELARRVVLTAQTIEKGSWARRTANTVYARFFTDRQISASYNFSMVRRPAALHRAVAGSRWTPPTFNAISTMGDVYSTRIWKNRPFINVTPLAAGGFKGRIRARRLSKFSDAVFEETKFWHTVEEIGQDAMQSGMGIVKVHEDQNNTGHIAISRVDPDELLVSEDEALHVPSHSLLQRVFIHRSDAMAKYGKTDEIRRAILRAPSIHPAFFDGADKSYRNVIALLEGWSLPTADGKPGRHVLVIDGCVLFDKPYLKRFFPFAYIRFKAIKGTWFGQGLVEQCLPLQRALNRIQAAIDEIQERCAWPHVWAEEGSQISVEQLAGVPGGVRYYTGKKPEFQSPDSVPKELLTREQWLIQLLQKRGGISDAAVAGTTPPGVTSGRALLAWSQIDDSRHVDLAQRLEDFVTQVAYLVFAVAEEVKPRVTVPGKRGAVIDWEDARLTFDPTDLTSSHFRARAFAMSRLPQTIAGREQQIRDWLDNKQISKEDALRLGVSPDLEGFADLATAMDDDTENSLDRIIEDGKWIPPLPFGDPALALSTAQSRYAHERAYEDTPKDRMDLLSQYIGVLKDRVEAASAAPPAGPAPGGAPPALAAPPQPNQQPAAMAA